MGWKLWVLGIVILFLALVLFDVWLSKGRQTPLASRLGRKRKVPKLGMEAIDEGSFASVVKKNAALAAKTRSGSASHSWTATAVAPAPFPEDETYAARYIGKHVERK